MLPFCSHHKKTNEIHDKKQTVNPTHAKLLFIRADKAMILCGIAAVILRLCLESCICCFESCVIFLIESQRVSVAEGVRVAYVAP